MIPQLRVHPHDLFRQTMQNDDFAGRLDQSLDNCPEAVVSYPIIDNVSVLKMFARELWRRVAAIPLCRSAAALDLHNAEVNACADRTKGIYA